MPPGFDILYEDAAFLIVSKPGGLLTQAPLGIDSLEVRVKRFLRERDKIAGDAYLGVPHRLDRPASGAIVFAKTIQAARKISKQFERRYVEKTYWALVEGEVTPDEATWTDLLKKIEGEPRTVVTTTDDPEGRLAILHYRVVRRLSSPHAPRDADRSPHAPREEPISRSEMPTEGLVSRSETATIRTLLEIDLETGRTHQIRVQCACRGHPLIGDQLYGSRQVFGPWSEDERERLIALHARTLRFLRPASQEYIEVVAPLPDVWREAGVEEE